MLTVPKFIEVTKLDGSKESVEMKRLNVTELHKYIEYLGGKNSIALVALATGKTPDWVNALEDESFGDLAKYAYDQNFQRAAKLSQKDALAAMMLGPYFAMALEINGTAGIERLPASPSPESTAAIPTVSPSALLTTSTSS